MELSLCKQLLHWGIALGNEGPSLSACLSALVCIGEWMTLAAASVEHTPVCLQSARHLAMSAGSQEIRYKVRADQRKCKKLSCILPARTLQSSANTT